MLCIYRILSDTFLAVCLIQQTLNSICIHSITASVDESPLCQSNNTGAVVGGVVALVAVIALTVVMVTYLVLRYRYKGKM